MYGRLLALPYPFRASYPLAFHDPAHSASTQLLKTILAKANLSLPLVLDLFYQKIGGVDFRWTIGENAPITSLLNTIFEKYYTDPLQIYALKELCTDRYLEERMISFLRGETTAFSLTLGSDLYLKEGISGAGTYEILIQDNRMLNPLLDLCELALDNVGFIDYLRLNFAQGGFMGFAFSDDLNAEAIAFRDKMRAGLRAI